MCWAASPVYEVTAGSVTFRGEDLLALDPHERAAKGLFLSRRPTDYHWSKFPGVSNVQFLREALNLPAQGARRRAVNGGENSSSSPEGQGPRCSRWDMDMPSRGK